MQLSADMRPDASLHTFKVNRGNFPYFGIYNKWYLYTKKW